MRRLDDLFDGTQFHLTLSLHTSLQPHTSIRTTSNTLLSLPMLLSSDRSLSTSRPSFGVDVDGVLGVETRPQLSVLDQIRDSRHCEQGTGSRTKVCYAQSLFISCSKTASVSIASRTGQRQAILFEQIGDKCTKEKIGELSRMFALSLTSLQMMLVRLCCVNSAPPVANQCTQNCYLVPCGPPFYLKSGSAGAPGGSRAPTLPIKCTTRIIATNPPPTSHAMSWQGPIRENKALRRFGWRTPASQPYRGPSRQFAPPPSPAPSLTFPHQSEDDNNAVIQQSNVRVWSLEINSNCQQRSPEATVLLRLGQ